jgi:hypothetical protein
LKLRLCFGSRVIPPTWPPSLSMSVCFCLPCFTCHLFCALALFSYQTGSLWSLPEDCCCSISSGFCFIDAWIRSFETALRFLHIITFLRLLLSPTRRHC